jgi:class 3 adenylate cyclase
VTATVSTLWFPRAVRLWLAAGVAVLAVYYALPAGLVQGTIFYPQVGLAAAIAIVAGTLWLRPEPRLPWLLFAAGQALFAIGDLLFGVYANVLHDDAFPSPADWLYLAGYPVLAAGLWLLVRERSTARDVGSLIDAAIVTVALGVVAWVLLMFPFANDDTLSALDTAVSIAYPLGDVLLIAVAARLVLDSGTRTVSYTLIGLSLVYLLVADFFYTLLSLDDRSSNALSAGWIVSYFLWGAAALHPSMRRLAQPAPDTVARLTPLRIVLLTVASLTPPALLVYRLDYVALAGSAVLFLLVIARLSGIVERHERALARESRMRAAATTLVGATTDEEIHRATVETALGFAGAGSASLEVVTPDGVVAAATAGDGSAAGFRADFPVASHDELRGTLTVCTASELGREERGAIETLAAQAALALETVARAREAADAERLRVRDMFTRFVPEAVAEQLLAQGGDSLRLGGETLHGTIMFTDLRNFTSFSESRPAEDVIAVVNAFLSEQTDTILAHGGTIIAYLGDGLMAAFGAPIEQADHADRALAASRELIGERLPVLNEWMRSHGYGDGFRMGIGLNSGPFISGNVGNERRLEYTAIGDVCNTAARIQELTKGTRHMLLFSDLTLEQLTTVPGDAVDVGATAIRGRQAAARLWSLEGVSDHAKTTVASYTR